MQDIAKHRVTIYLLPLLFVPPISANEQADTSTNQHETIVVTAELMNRTIAQSGNSVEIFDADTIESTAGFNTLRNVLDSVGNITTVTGTGKAPSVRGVDGTGAAENANAFFAGSRQRLSWQIDGRPASYNEVVFSDMALFDVEQIEVLRGPQSSLVGRNAIAGTIIVNTHKPQFYHEGKFRLAAGSDQYRQYAGMVNVPMISDSLAFRLTGNLFQKHSQVNFDPYPGVDNPAEIEGKRFSGKLLFEPSSDESLLLNVTHSDYFGPNGEIIVRPFEEQRSNYPQQPRHRPKTTSAIVDYKYRLGDNWQVDVNGSTTDFSFTRYAVPNTSNASIDTREYVFEPKLSYQQGDAAAVVGIYYYHADQEEFIEFMGGQHFDDKTETVAIYAEGAIPLTPEVQLSLGLRHEHESRQRKGGDPTGQIASISSDETYDVLLPKLGLNWQASSTNNLGIQISKGYNSGGGGVTFAMPIVNYQYDEETVWTYEIYGRQSFMGGKIRTTQNLFFSQYKDMQLPFDLTPEDSRDEAFVIKNADKVETKGLELGIAATLPYHFSLWGNLSLLDTEIVDYPNSGIEGNELLTAPTVTASLGVTWQKDNWLVGINSRFSDNYYTDINNRPGGKTDRYTVFDAKVNYQWDNVVVFATVNNLFDNNKPVARYPGFDNNLPNSALDTAVKLQPRSFHLGVEIGY
ncbi:TonB-dependent receptor [Thaumasiovibrio subtropicus]|uniref:TonB-dependent receptor n=1 Tax=Thaumasiovibrio subtropicus TaxID=1891207 RepID=UPI000B34CFBC|nr:TonB-dependent receptor [Thaumasiovibrio subtropicus]